MAVTITDSQQVTGTVQAVDAKGAPAAIEAGSLSVQVDDPSILEATIDADGQGILVKGLKPGSTTLHVTADADLGEGVAPITADILFDVTAGQAVGLGVQFSDPVEQQ